MLQQLLNFIDRKIFQSKLSSLREECDYDTSALRAYVSDFLQNEKTDERRINIFMEVYCAVLGSQYSYFSRVSYDSAEPDTWTHQTRNEGTILEIVNECGNRIACRYLLEHTSLSAPAASPSALPEHNSGLYQRFSRRQQTMNIELISRAAEDEKSADSTIYHATQHPLGQQAVKDALLPQVFLFLK